ncbi:hypothetical protein LEMLEM_LOCUS15400 [Lemmus lemmus]
MMNVTFQSGAMELQLSVQKTCTQQMEIFAMMVVIAIKGHVTNMRHTVR